MKDHTLPKQTCTGLALMMWGRQNLYAANILQLLIEQGCYPAAILLEENTPAGTLADYFRRWLNIYRKKGGRGVCRRLSQRVVFLMERAGILESYASPRVFARVKDDMQFYRPELNFSQFDLQALGTDLFLCGNNSPDATEYLNSRGIRIVILAGTRIISSGTLAQSRADFVNMHPGYLPYMRGFHSDKWSVCAAVNPGATLHFVDAGIDTGRIIDRETIPIEEGDTLMSLRFKSIDLGFRLLLRHVQGLCDGSIGPASCPPQPLDIGRRSSAMTLPQYLRARRHLRCLQEMIRVRTTLGLPDPGIFYPRRDVED